MTEEKDRMDGIEAPDQDRVGEEGSWTLPGEEEEPLRLEGAFLGMSSSRRSGHLRHAGDFASRGERCSACRWFEPRIFREVSGRERFLLHQTGVSRVPGESDRVRIRWMLTAAEVVEALVTRGTSGTFLTEPARLVLAQAAEFDEELHAARRERLQRIA